MNAMNQIILEGNITRDSTIKVIGKGTKVAIMPVACNRSYRDQNGEFQSEVSYFEIEAWGEAFAGRVALNGVKGRGVRVVGRLKQNRWKDEEGKNHEKYLIIAEHVDFKPEMKEKPVPQKIAEPVPEPAMAASF